MSGTYSHRFISRTLRVLSLLLLLSASILASAAAVPSQAASNRLQTAPRAQARLLQLAAQRPSDTISVIVQQQPSAGASVEQQVAALGGRVTRDLSIINAFAAELPAWALAGLAQAEGVRWISLNAPVVESGTKTTSSNLRNIYNRTTRADLLWQEGLLGQGITVAVVDSGVGDPGMPSTLADFDTGKRILATVKTNSATNNASDRFEHGTHVGGLIAGDGTGSNGAYIGMAPEASLINVKVSDDEGSATAADVVAGMQWIYENQDKYKIRVVNLSLNSSVNESYHKDPLCAAAEILWFNGMVVVVSAGNDGKNALYPPANDPFLITVGAIDEKGTAERKDDNLASFSGYGTTIDGFAKPELAAPGVSLVSTLVSRGAVLPKLYPGHIVPGEQGNQDYFRMSGTSMAAPVVAGAAALLLQDEPNLTPDQVKHRLIATVYPNGKNGSGAGTLDAYAAVHGTTTESANTGIEVSNLLTTGDDPVTWDSINWDSINWGSVNWGSVNWGSVNWGSVNWGSVNWDQ